MRFHIYTVKYGGILLCAPPEPVELVAPVPDAPVAPVPDAPDVLLLGPPEFTALVDTECV
ncbi:MAG: hypothetical protein IKR04_04965 [Clostridia bacterium]|nr:hypothetical protein [Clostridia bacterium]